MTYKQNSSFSNLEISEICNENVSIFAKGNRRRSIGHCPCLWNPLQPIHRSQPIDCSCPTIKDFIVQDEMVAVETSTIASTIKST